MNVNKVLFIGLSSVGDVVMTSPLLTSLQNEYPQALFDIVVDKRGIELYKNFPNFSTQIFGKHCELSANAQKNLPMFMILHGQLILIICMTHFWVQMT